MTAEDMSRIAEIFAAQGFPYDLPKLGSSNILARRVVTSGDQVIAGAAARLTVEVFSWFDPAWSTPAFRHAALQLLHEEMRIELAEKGVEDGHAWLAPQIARAYGRRLMKLGWQQQQWPSFVRSTNG